MRTSFAAQWRGTCLPTNAGDTGRVHVWALRATKPMYHEYWAQALEPRGCSYWARNLCTWGPTSCNCWTREQQLLRLPPATTEACVPRACAPQQEKRLNEKPVHSSEEHWTCGPQAKSTCSNKGPAQPKVNTFSEKELYNLPFHSLQLQKELTMCGMSYKSDLFFPIDLLWLNGLSTIYQEHAVFPLALFHSFLLKRRGTWWSTHRSVSEIIFLVLWSQCLSSQQDTTVFITVAF